MAAVEQVLGPVDKVQVEWRTYVREHKAKLSGDNLHLERSPRPPAVPGSPLKPGAGNR
jgi:hypothetical protein